MRPRSAQYDTERTSPEQNRPPKTLDQNLGLPNPWSPICNPKNGNPRTQRRFTKRLLICGLAFLCFLLVSLELLYGDFHETRSLFATWNTLT